MLFLSFVVGDPFETLEGHQSKEGRMHTLAKAKEERAGESELMEGLQRSQGASQSIS